MNKKVSMREQMPQVAAIIDAIIDAFREAFGAEVVDAAIRRGMRGGQGFHATENGHEVGTPVYRGVPLDRTPEPYLKRMGEVVWKQADVQTVDNEKGQGNGS